VAATTLIEIPSWGTASLIEIVWTLCGVAVIVFSVYGIPYTISLWRTAVQQGDEVMEILAGGYVRRESFRVIQGVLIAAIGVYGCVIGQPRPGPVVVSPVGLFLTCGLLLIGATIAAQSMLDRRQQRRTTELLDELPPPRQATVVTDP
jgi:hypothetical protein